ncbi:trypsin-like peptidase domain-containing protein [Marinobacterium weihaiense]|uniref:Trypsin-like peptidase domain-containing protein n=1 Tax=Marinobacterium weihaiense TaxID=2851016 RepID=A0ABS6M9X4_9GAMM|nr:trypsin-like peptidase domain-containing protein [Marinobacterium weihaiense]MBV0933083.1 trypsin-like peptidase domain-containing protein [Marinobacterium weihaiense]
MRKVSYLIWPVITGVLAAVLILQFYPQLITPPVNRVEIREAAAVDPPMPAPGQGVVSYADAVDRAAPAVVNIYTRTLVRQPVNPLLNDPFFRNFFNRDQLPQRERIESSLGSGVILNEQGYVVTNNHVISGADSIVVALRDGREALAEVVGLDPETDLAVLKIDLDNLPSITLASDELRIGDVALAIGNPFGVGQTVTMGIISATGRNRLGLSTYEDFIQTDAAINPGNSGGALIDAHGNLIGINTAIFSKSGGSQGIGFAIPSTLARQVMQDLINHGRVIRGWLGVEIQELTPQLAESFDVGDRPGLIIAGIFRNGPAHQAGLQPGDVLLQIQGQPIVGSRPAMNRIAGFKPGDVIELGILRNGHEMSLNATVGERPRGRN